MPLMIRGWKKNLVKKNISSSLDSGSNFIDIFSWFLIQFWMKNYVKDYISLTNSSPVLNIQVELLETETDNWKIYFSIQIFCFNCEENSIWKGRALKSPQQFFFLPLKSETNVSWWLGKCVIVEGWATVSQQLFPDWTTWSWGRANVRQLCKWQIWAQRRRTETALFRFISNRQASK